MRSALIGVGFSFALGGCLVPPDAKPDVGINLDVATAYVHRGMPQTQREVLQGGTDIWLPTRGGGDMHLMGWGNLDLTSDKGDAWFPDGASGQISEIDIVADYSREVGPVSLTAGLHNYQLPRANLFPNGPRGATTELFLRASGEIATVRPSLELDIDVDEAEGLYARAGVDRDFILNEKFDARVGVGLGYSDEDHSAWAYDLPEAGFADLTAQATLGYSYDVHTHVHLTLAGSTMLDSELRDWFDILGIDSDNVWLSLGVNWSY